MTTLQPYRGLARKLVLGIDVGTTYSGVAYAFLDPGEVPKIQGVTRYPGQERAVGTTKIPSIMYYRQDGTVHSVGAEAAMPAMASEAEAQDLIFVKWFKLHLRPQHLDSQDDSLRRSLPALPDGKTAVDVFADMLAYLLRCARVFISETHANGPSLWASVERSIEFVLSHPNGWEGPQQGKMREAAVKARLIPDTSKGQSRVYFVTEGEASLNFCIRNGFTNELVRAGNGVMVVDAGGGTIDVSSYSFLSTAPVSVQELVPADCIVQGSTQVNVRAEKFLRERLKDSQYGDDDDIQTMLDFFDDSTKLMFRTADEVSYVKFGSIRCSDPKANIRRGQLMLSGQDMLSFFLPSFVGIMQVVQKQHKAASHPITTVFLVGGFAASPWLYATLQETLDRLGLRLFRPDTHTNKAVAEGAVSFFLEHFVAARVMRKTYGISTTVEYEEADSEHFVRQANRFVRPSGRIEVPERFSIMLKKGERMCEGEEISQAYYQEARETRTLDTIECRILCYRGKETDPRWVDDHPELFPELCTVYADTSGVARRPQQGPFGMYYVQQFEIVLICGLTELQAQISWSENGKERRGPAKIIYEDDLLVSQ